MSEVSVGLLLLTTRGDMFFPDEASTGPCSLEVNEGAPLAALLDRLLASVNLQTWRGLFLIAPHSSAIAPSEDVMMMSVASVASNPSGSSGRSVLRLTVTLAAEVFKLAVEAAHEQLQVDTLVRLAVELDAPADCLALALAKLPSAALNGVENLGLGYSEVFNPLPLPLHYALRSPNRASVLPVVLSAVISQASALAGEEQLAAVAKCATASLIAEDGPAAVLESLTAAFPQLLASADTCLELLDTAIRVCRRTGQLHVGADATAIWLVERCPQIVTAESQLLGLAMEYGRSAELVRALLRAYPAAAAVPTLSSCSFNNWRMRDEEDRHTTDTPQWFRLRDGEGRPHGGRGPVYPLHMLLHCWYVPGYSELLPELLAAFPPAVGAPPPPACDQPRCKLPGVHLYRGWFPPDTVYYGSNALHAASVGRAPADVVHVLLEAAQRLQAVEAAGAAAAVEAHELPCLAAAAADDTASPLSFRFPSDLPFLLRQQNAHGDPPLLVALANRAPLETIALLVELAPDVATSAWCGGPSAEYTPRTALYAALAPCEDDRPKTLRIRCSAGYYDHKHKYLAPARDAIKESHLEPRIEDGPAWNLARFLLDRFPAGRAVSPPWCPDAEHAASPPWRRYAAHPARSPPDPAPEFERSLTPPYGLLVEADRPASPPLVAADEVARPASPSFVAAAELARPASPPLVAAAELAPPAGSFHFLGAACEPVASAAPCEWKGIAYLRGSEGEFPLLTALWATKYDSRWHRSLPAGETTARDMPEEAQAAAEEAEKAAAQAESEPVLTQLLDACPESALCTRRRYGDYYDEGAVLRCVGLACKNVVPISVLLRLIDLDPAGAADSAMHILIAAASRSEVASALLPGLLSDSRRELREAISAAGHAILFRTLRWNNEWISSRWSTRVTLHQSPHSSYRRSFLAFLNELDGGTALCHPCPDSAPLDGVPHTLLALCLIRARQFALDDVTADVRAAWRLYLSPGPLETAQVASHCKSKFDDAQQMLLDLISAAPARQIAALAASGVDVTAMYMPSSEPLWRRQNRNPWRAAPAGSGAFASLGSAAAFSAALGARAWKRRGSVVLARAVVTTRQLRHAAASAEPGDAAAAIAVAPADMAQAPVDVSEPDCTSP